jgi:large subunit ribosomal protein L3
MISGLWGKKIGMTQIFADNGQVVPVTVIDVAHWIVTQIKTAENDGYAAVQLGCLKKGYEGEEFSSDWLKQPQRYFSVIQEVHIVDTNHDLQVGKRADIAALLAKGDSVDVFGQTIGRGFQGGVKRHGFTGGPATHGDCLGRRPGSIGFMRSRGRVIKGWNMAGHMGADRRVMKNLEIMRIEADAHIVLVKGSVPGKSGSLVYMRKCR